MFYAQQANALWVEPYIDAAIVSGRQHLERDVFLHPSLNPP
jgi:hypothetical protein